MLKKVLSRQDDRLSLLMMQLDRHTNATHLQRNPDLHPLSHRCVASLTMKESVTEEKVVRINMLTGYAKCIANLVSAHTNPLVNLDTQIKNVMSGCNLASAILVICVASDIQLQLRGEHLKWILF